MASQSTSRRTQLFNKLDDLCYKWSIQCLQSQGVVSFNYHIYPKRDNKFDIKFIINSPTHIMDTKMIVNLNLDLGTINSVALWLLKFLSNSYHGAGVKVDPPPNCGY